MAEKSTPPPPGYPLQTYAGQQPPQQPYFNAPGGQPSPAGYVNPQPQQQPLQGTPGQYVPQGVPYPTQSQGAQYYPQQQPGQTPVFVPVQQPSVVLTQPPVVLMSGQCNPGQHIYRVHYGACGIITAILLFPIGLIFLLVDQERRCIRCGASG